jgi:hypothetical protein
VAPLFSPTAETQAINGAIVFALDESERRNPRTTTAILSLTGSLLAVSPIVPTTSIVTDGLDVSKYDHRGG